MTQHHFAAIIVIRQIQLDEERKNRKAQKVAATAVNEWKMEEKREASSSAYTRTSCTP